MKFTQKVLFFTLITAIILSGVFADKALAEFDYSREYPIEYGTEPSQIVLTWQNDPMSTMTITWRTDVDEEAYLYYADEPGYELEYFKENPRDYNQVLAENYTFAETDAWLHRVELTDLEPGSKYPVVVETAENTSEPFYFETAPDPNAEEEIKFVVGGDSRTGEFDIGENRVRRELNYLAAQQDPDAIIFSGDLINTWGSEREWDDWFDDWHNYVITEDQRRIPIIPAIGNHEVDGYYGRETKDAAPYYYGRFNLPGEEKYYVLQYGPAVILTLDSDHTTPYDNMDQLRFINESLENHQEEWPIIVQQHVAAWPSSTGRDFDSDRKAFFRNRWWPMFERGGVDLVTENHDHLYKITVPISQGKIALAKEVEDTIEEAKQKAREEFDNEMQELSEDVEKAKVGRWEEAGYDNWSEAFSEVIFEVKMKRLSEEEDFNLYEIPLWHEFLEKMEQRTSEDEIVAIGDGAWGAPLRTPEKPEENWWLHDTASEDHFWIVTITEEQNEMIVEPLFLDEQDLGNSFTIERDFN